MRMTTQVVASAIVDKYIGESARVIREMFGYAREHAPCVIFMDEIDAIGGKRYNEGTSAGMLNECRVPRDLQIGHAAWALCASRRWSSTIAHSTCSRSKSDTDREIQRTLMELLAQLDGFDNLGQVKIIMATNRPDILDPALMR